MGYDGGNDLKKNNILHITLCIGILFLLFTLSFYGGFHLGKSKHKLQKSVAVMKYATYAYKFREYPDKDRVKRKKVFPQRSAPANGNKIVFLTFDDGPSENNTLKVLDILKSRGIKASFFELGNMQVKYPSIVEELKKNGMCIVSHGYSHDYNIYKSPESFWEDFNKSFSIIEEITSKKVNFIRFPGGSDNLVSKASTLSEIRREVKEKGIFYVDWNVSSADAAPGIVPKEKIKENIINGCAGRKLSVTLMHDSEAKITTVEALPDILDYLKNKGYEFKTLDDMSAEELQELIKEKIINR